MNPLSQDAAIPKREYLELPESTRFRQDQPQQQQLNQDHDVLNQNPDVGRNLEPAQRPPTWLTKALSGQPNPRDESDQNPNNEVCPVCSGRGSCMCSSRAMHDGGGASSSNAFQQVESGYADWLAARIGSSSHFEHGPAGKLESDLPFPQQAARMVTELNLLAAHGRENSPHDVVPDLGQQSCPGGQPSNTGEVMTAEERAAQEQENWEELRRRCLIVTHPRYQEMLERHAECLRAGAPVDQLPTIQAQLEEAATVTEKYRALRDQIAETTPDEQAELDEFMSGYPPLLAGFRDTLQNHVRNDVTEAMMSCWEIEQKLIALTGLGVRLEDGYAGATMSDDDVDYDSDYGSYDRGIDYNNNGGFGSVVPSETERSLMERVRQELKQKLNQGYKSKIKDVREEIMRKRRAGRLPEGTTAILKAWWQAHSKWPYPTEHEKEILMQETGLKLKQVNNWFINQRKRNWHNTPLASAHASDSGKNKARKSW